MRRCVWSGDGVGGGQCAVPAGSDLCLLKRDGPAVQQNSGRWCSRQFLLANSGQFAVQDDVYLLL